jgi:hypothetical protein
LLKKGEALKRFNREADRLMAIRRNKMAKRNLLTSSEDEDEEQEDEEQEDEGPTKRGRGRQKAVGRGGLKGLVVARSARPGFKPIPKKGRVIANNSDS